MGFEVLAVIRGDRQFAPGPNISFRENDIVLVKGEMKHLMEVKIPMELILLQILWIFINRMRNR